MDILKRIDKLPDVLINIIKTYLTINTIIFLNKTNYLTNHKKLYINKDIFENYVRDMARKDNWFVLNQILKENFKKWLKIKYKYKNIIYYNYVSFLTSFCIENHATNCKNIINIFLKKHGISKNQHKNNTFINIKWKN